MTTAGYLRRKNGLKIKDSTTKITRWHLGMNKELSIVERLD